MSYAVKEIYATLQGEGYQTGRPAVFLRFAGCNLWSGLEEGRERAICRFCDTDFVGLDGPAGGRYDAEALAAKVKQIWEAEIGAAFTPFVVITGGEPLLQLDQPLIAALHALGFSIAIETNGTLPAPEGLDWICVSPKAGAPLVLTAGDELKLVYPQPEAPPEQFAALAFQHFSLQPMDGPDRERNTDAARDYCTRHPQWKLSLQTHKLLGIP